MQSQDITPSLRVEFAACIADISSKEWNQLMQAGDLSCNPFIRHEYLAALESSGCVSSQTGWTPLHLSVFQGEQRVAVMPLYVKTHSYGEYVFDWAWAEAYERYEINYYPKLVSAVPFTPVSGVRLGIAAGISAPQAQAISAFIVSSLNSLCARKSYSGWHCLFLPKLQHQAMAQQGTLNRIGTQFHWRNKGYVNFDAFLGAMNSRKRKNIIKERRKVEVHDFTFSFIKGIDVSEAQWGAFYACYQLTYAKRSGHYGYLSLDFFKAIALSMPEQIRLLLVQKRDVDGNNTQPTLASALYFCSETHLYGRYWGALVDVDGLHFEACYYRGIDYCIEQGLAVFDAGAQGEHKLARGFEPVMTYSNHEITHPQFRAAISDFTQDEALQMQIYMTQMQQSSPFKAKSKSKPKP